MRNYLLQHLILFAATWKNNKMQHPKLLEHQNKGDATSLINMRKSLLTATPRNHHLMQHQTFTKRNMQVLL